MINKNGQNPFKITTPEDLSAEETVSLFVDVFSDFYQITDPGHVIIKGPRGVGKSMMLRYLEPDCQCLATKKRLSELPYIAVYIPLKNTNFALAELKQFDGKHAYTLLNEHIMIVHCLIKVFEIFKNENLIDDIDFNRLLSFYKNEFNPILGIDTMDEELIHTAQLLNCITGVLNTMYRDVMRYVKRSAFSNDVEPYKGELFDYINYFVPLMEGLGDAISECDTTFYLMMDDAHYLSDSQTRILNSWIASRTSRKVSIKVSTQYNYKNYYTINGSTVDTPHDYVELDLATVYTEGNKKAKSTYYNRIADIVQKRLKVFGIKSNVKDFFPVDIDQEMAIRKIREEYIERFDCGKGRGYNRTDDAQRYARPDYIKSLGGISKSSHSYSYAGFDQLVNISSGVVRYFLQQAHAMYAKQQATLDEGEEINYISASIQNDVVREIANQVLFNDLESYSKEGHDDAYPKEDIDKLANLIQGLGGLFKAVLLSDKSERRVFSIAISDKPSEVVLRILDIGIQLGYFHKSTIGRKNAGSIGRTKLYVLNRILAPIWTLDPNGFAGYLFIKNRVLEDAISNPIKMITSSNIYKNKYNEDDDIQMSLFELYPEMYEESEVEVVDGESED